MLKVRKFHLSPDMLFITFEDGSASQYNISNDEYEKIKFLMPIDDINNVLEVINNFNMKNAAKITEYDLKHDLIEERNDLFYLKGSIYPLPKSLVKIFIEKGVQEQYVNFWLWLSKNPVFAISEIHETLFEYLNQQGFQLTKHGAIVAYRNVNKKDVRNSNLMQFVIGQLAYCKSTLKQSPVNYYVKDNGDGTYDRITEKAFNKDKTGILGTLTDVYHKYSVDEVYTSAHTGMENYRVGEEYSVEWSEVDTSNRSCSRGLHFTYWDALKQSYAIGSHKVAILINPIDIASVPSGYQGGKGRCRRFYLIGEVNEPLQLNDDNVLEAFDDWMEKQMEELNVQLNSNGIINTGKLNTLNYDLNKVQEVIADRYDNFDDDYSDYDEWDYDE